MRLFVFALAVSLAGPAHAAGLLDYLVFAKTGIQSQSSDYQGATASAGPIELSHFEIKGDLHSSESIRMAHGSVRGTARAPQVTLNHVGGRRGSYGSSTERQILGSYKQLDEITRWLSSFAPTNTAAFVQREINGAWLTGLDLVASQEIEVVDIDASTLQTTDNLFLSGNDRALLLVRIHGQLVDFSHKGVFVVGGIRPEQVTFFFPEATSLELSYSGGPLGIPGTVVAPGARVHFAEILVTGHLYAGTICTDGGLNGGQVNAARSTLLERAHRDCEPCRRP